MQATNNPSAPHAIIDDPHYSKDQFKPWSAMRDVFTELMDGMSGIGRSRFHISVEPVKTGGHRQPGYQQSDQDYVNIANAAKKRLRRRMKRSVYQRRCESHNPCLSTA